MPLHLLLTKNIKFMVRDLNFGNVTLLLNHELFSIVFNYTQPVKPNK